MARYSDTFSVDMVGQQETTVRAAVEGLLSTACEIEGQSIVIQQTLYGPQPEKASDGQPPQKDEPHIEERLRLMGEILDRVHDRLANVQRRLGV